MERGSTFLRSMMVNSSIKTLYGESKHEYTIPVQTRIPIIVRIPN